MSQAREPTASQTDVSLGVLHGFHPGWFGVVMGTAVIGIIAFSNPGKIAGLTSAAHGVALAAMILAAALTVVFGIPYVARWFVHPRAALADLRHPVAGPLYGTFPGGLLVLAVTVAVVGPRYLSLSTVHDLVAGLAWVGVPLAFVVSVVFASLLFLNPEIETQSANGAWFIPPVVNIVVPLALVPLISSVGVQTARLLLVLGYVTWGMGLFLFILVASLLFDRLIFHALPPAPLAPSLWISLGPLGVGGLALLRLAQAGAPLWGAASGAVQAVSLMVALALWGFGLWWLTVAIVLLVRYLRAGGVPFGVGLWAFTFPLGALTAVTVALARALNLGALEGIGAVLFLVLVVSWVLVAASTVFAMANGRAWAR